jgi:hypothetical protein
LTRKQNSKKFVLPDWIRNMNPKNRPNGHGALLARGSGANGRTILLSGMGGAASDDASELSVANAAASTAAAGAGREATAEVAPAGGKGKRRQTAGAASRSKKKKADKTASAANAPREIVPGLEPLPIDGEAFVDAVHAQVDLVQLEVDLLSSPDDKIVQRELAYLRELRYGKRASIQDGEPQIILDMQRPERDSS